MKTSIHKTAIIDKNANIDDDVVIEPYAIIESDTFIGRGTVIGANSIVKKFTSMGKNNVVHSNVVIGDLPQDLVFDRNIISYVEIGDSNIIREFATIHRSKIENAKTIIKDNCFLMANSHVAHDCFIDNNVIICNGSLVAGHVEVHKGAFISGNCAIHQFCKIGQHAMIGGITSVNQDILPFALTGHGEKARVYGINKVGMLRAGFTYAMLSEVENMFDTWYNWNKTKQEFLDLYLNNDSIGNISKIIINFIQNSKRGITPRKLQ